MTFVQNISKAVNENIARILNHVAASGEIPSELKTGILVPLQKPGKSRGPPSNLRPVILLSLLRKILAICLIRRIGQKIDDNIPLSQAAYRAGRGTTEQLLTIKLLAEKAITTPNYHTHLLMMDMSKAFDRVERSKVIEDLEAILEPDELHLVKVLIEDVKLAVRVNGRTGKSFTTNIGTPQGDCLSPILFTLYLANAMKDTTDTPVTRENHPNLAPHIRDHCYSTNNRTGLMIPLQYADDICWLGMNSSHTISDVKDTIPEQLAKRNLTINNAKTEEYIISKNGDPAWMKCKYLGTMLDTHTDIKSRKRNANNAMRIIEHILKDKRVSLQTKLRVFNAYVTSIFLYNSETWTITQTTADTIDSFHRNLLRNVMNIRWPAKISNVNLYLKTEEIPWSSIIRQRRLRLYGHIIRLPEETPINIALNEYQRPLKKSRGAPRFTWNKNINQDLESIGLNQEKAKTLCKDRKNWRALVSNSVEKKNHAGR